MSLTDKAKAQVMKCAKYWGLAGAHGLGVGCSRETGPESLGKAEEPWASEEENRSVLFRKIRRQLQGGQGQLGGAAARQQSWTARQQKCPGQRTLEAPDSRTPRSGEEAGDA